jgi:Methylmalonyl-CoA mutase
VEEAVLAEFEAISARGGVLGAMETGYQRGRIQDESTRYEQRKHDGTLPVIGVNTFRNPAGTVAVPAELARATEEEKKSQLERVRDFTERHREQAHAALAELKEVARSGGNVFAVLMDAARVCSLQQITEAFFEVGGRAGLGRARPRPPDPRRHPDLARPLDGGRIRHVHRRPGRPPRPGQHLRRPPRRYPHVDLPDLEARGPDLIVLPDEPYPFSATDGPEMFPGHRVALVQGRDLTWYGPSLVTARSALQSRLHAAARP